ncbi:MAG TPA: cytochrome P460 family protein [Verrucomicrobiae bacterium]
MISLVGAYPQWRTLLDAPMKVSLRSAVDCAGAPPHTGGSPHYVPFIQLYANPTAWTASWNSNTRTMPVGSMIVKEKLDGTNRLGYAAMHKRAPGFDPAHGDWEYTYFDSSLSNVTARGAIPSCRNCHENARESDYLFRAYGRLIALSSNTNGPLQLRTITIRPPK